MAKRKGLSISLAAKCQLLFGLAVLVIIAGALAVPWQRMEQLAKQPNIKAARFAADLVFRQMHAGMIGTGPATTTSATTTAPAATAGANKPTWSDAAMGDVDYPPPTMFTLKSADGP